MYIYKDIMGFQVSGETRLEVLDKLREAFPAEEGYTLDMYVDFTTIDVFRNESWQMAFREITTP
jgi:hypothetical protein